jgi:hypothetical protein
MTKQHIVFTIFFSAITIMNNTTTMEKSIKKYKTSGTFGDGYIRYRYPDPDPETIGSFEEYASNFQFIIAVNAMFMKLDNTPTELIQKYKADKLAIIEKNKQSIIERKKNQ